MRTETILPLIEQYSTNEMSMEKKESPMNRVLVALNDEEVKKQITKVLEGDEDEYHIHFCETISTLDSLLSSYTIDIIILDFNFQNGVLADWLSLWPIPFVVIADVDERERLKEMMKDEVSSFLIHEPSYSYLSVLPLTIKKVLYYRELQDIQNRQIQWSEKRYLELVRALPDVVYHIDSHGNFLFINDSVKTMLGYDPTELIGKHFSEILQPEEVEKVSKNEVLKKYAGKKTGEELSPKIFDERRTGKRKTINLVVRLKHKREEEAEPHLGIVTAFGEISASGFGFNREAGPNGGTVGIIRDVTEKVYRERLLRKANDEKSTLLSEIHHRVNNNLQLILSLINLHNEERPEDGVPPLLREIQAEVHSMALVHEQLYKSETVNKVNMHDYINNLFYSLLDIHDVAVTSVSFSLMAEHCYLELEKATPVGLILNELTSASLTVKKPTDNEPREIRIELHNENENHLHIIIEDEIIFTLLKEFEPGTTATGLQLVYILIEQLDGEVLFEEDDRKRIRISIPLKR